MRISGLEVRLREIREKHGDLEILGEGYPGDLGEPLVPEGIMVAKHDREFDRVFIQEGCKAKGKKVLFFHW